MMAREKLSQADLELFDGINNDQQHVNNAYKLCKAMMRELLSCRRLDNEIASAMRGMYKIEDILWQYTTN